MKIDQTRLLEIIQEEVFEFESSKQSKMNENIVQLVLEGIYDKGILKAVFMAGGPGSGKSYTAGAIFGGNAIANATNQASTAMGLRVVNSDPAFEMYLKQAGISPSDLAAMSDEEFKAVTEPKDSPRAKASKMKKTAQAGHELGRIGLIIDGTGDDAGKIASRKAAVEDLGYDTMMVFVNTTLEMAQERNKKRERVLPEDLVEEIWTSVQSNLSTFQGMFGNFVIIDNTEYEWSAAEAEAAGAAVSFVESPVQNPIGRQWVEDAITAKGADSSDPWVKDQVSKILG